MTTATRHTQRFCEWVGNEEDKTVGTRLPEELVRDLKVIEQAEWSGRLTTVQSRRPRWDGCLGMPSSCGGHLLGISRETVASEISNPSFSNSLGFEES
jgi:hypothetical protein